MKRILILVAIFVAGAYFGKPIIEKVLGMLNIKLPTKTPSVDVGEVTQVTIDDEGNVIGDVGMLQKD